MHGLPDGWAVPRTATAGSLAARAYTEDEIPAPAAASITAPACGAMPSVLRGTAVAVAVPSEPRRLGDARPSRRNFLRLRLWTSAGGIALLLVAAVPWLLLVFSWLNADGPLRVFLVFACLAWGALFLPLVWLGWKILRLAWRPLVVWRRPGNVIEGERVD